MELWSWKTETIKFKEVEVFSSAFPDSPEIVLVIYCRVNRQPWIQWLPSNKHFTMAWILRGRNVDRKLTCLCSLIPGVSTEKTWRAGRDLRGLELELPGGVFTHVSGAWTGVTWRLNWAGNVFMAFPCSTCFSFVVFGFLRGNVLRRSFWRGNVPRK